MTPESTTNAHHAGGVEDLVQLDKDHPGFRDAAYRARRNAIARAALEYTSGPVPEVDYTVEEQAVWRTVWAKLGPLHEELACRRYLEVSRALALGRERIPQLHQLNPALQDGVLKGYGAGVLSSAGEIQRFRSAAKLLPWDPERMASTPYDPTEYQPHYFVAPSFERMISDLTAWLEP